MGQIANISTLLLSVIFGALSMLHFAWALGIKWGFDASLPTNEDGEKVLNPRKRDCAIVGLGLMLFAAYYFSKLYGIALAPSRTIEIIAAWMIPLIFLVRTIGDFKYVGLSKRVKNTPFAKLDTKLIIPLCMLIVALGAFVAIN